MTMGLRTLSLISATLLCTGINTADALDRGIDAMKQALYRAAAIILAWAVIYINAVLVWTT